MTFCHLSTLHGHWSNDHFITHLALSPPDRCRAATWHASCALHSILQTSSSRSASTGHSRRTAAPEAHRTWAIKHRASGAGVSSHVPVARSLMANAQRSDGIGALAGVQGAWCSGICHRLTGNGEWSVVKSECGT